VPGRETVITNVLTGLPARGILTRLIREQGPISEVIPAYPLATPAFAPLRAKAEAQGSGDFSSFWSGQGGVPTRSMAAGALTRETAEQALEQTET
jgi:nitronate monooxygenase